LWGRISKGLAAIFFGQALVIAANVLLVPLYLGSWSPTLYGEWLALFSLVSYLSTLDLGMNMAVTNQLTQTYACGKLDEYARYQHSATAFYVFVAVTGSILLAVAVCILPLATWMGLREVSAIDAAWVAWLLGIQLLLSLVAGLIAGVYRTTGDLAKSQWTNNCQRTLLFASITAALALGGGVVAVAAVQIWPLVLVSLLATCDIRRRYHTLLPGLSRVSLSAIRDLLGPSLFFFLIMLANGLTQQGPILLVSSAMGGAAVAMLAVSRTLTNLIRQTVGAFNSALWPDITRLEASGNLTQLRTLHHLLVVSCSTLCVVLAVVLWYHGAEIIRVWTGGKLEPDSTLLRLLVVQLVMQSPWIASSTFSAAANRHRILARSYLISGIVGLAVTAILLGRIGIWAVPVGLMLGEAMACYHFVVRDTCRLIGQEYGTFIIQFWRGMAIVTVGAMAVGWASQQTIPGPFLIRWTGTGVVTSATAIIVAWTAWLTREERMILLLSLRNVACRK